MGGFSTKDMLVTKVDLIDVLCDYIMAIQDDATLEQVLIVLSILCIPTT
jgi:hypothetical protein